MISPVEPSNKINLDRFSANARSVIFLSVEIAKKSNAKQLDLIHLFAAILQTESLARDYVLESGVDIEATIKGLEASDLYKNISQNVSLDAKLGVSKTFKDILVESFKLALEEKNTFVGTEHIFLALLSFEEHPIISELIDKGISKDSFRRFLKINQPFFSGGQLPLGGAMALNNLASIYPPQTFSSQQPINDDFEAEKLLQNLNEILADGYEHKITGRDKEISRLIHVLSRKYKNNVLLLGNPGVGKTAIVDGFVQRILKGEVPPSLQHAVVYSLSIASIIAGARLRGDVEERVESVIDKLSSQDNAILFIDEIHMIVGAGATSIRDSMDIGNILKPYLTRGDFRVIGATTREEYQNNFDTDQALARRFQIINVEELSKEASKRVLIDIKRELEAYHNVKITEESLDFALEATDRYIHDRYLPDKAIDVLDEAAALVKIGREEEVAPSVAELRKKLTIAQNKKIQNLEKGDLKEASKWKSKELDLLNKIEDLLSGKVKRKTRKSNKIVTPDVIVEVMRSVSNVPILSNKIETNMVSSLITQNLNKIVGQDEIISKVILSIERSMIGLSKHDKPLASFLFLGPTGVGKTETAKAIAQDFFGSKSNLLQINMSEFIEPHSISKLIGSPPGYVGYTEGGRLTDFLRAKPYSVILFDEIEKAHPDVLNILLQILDEGEVVDGKSNKVSARNAVIVLTSNIGAIEIQKDSSLGFELADQGSEADYEFLKEKVMSELNHHLKPELINRIDSILVFRPLSTDHAIDITEQMIQELSISILKKGVVLEYSSDIVVWLAERGFSREYGARNIKRVVMNELENALSEFILTKKLKIAPVALTTIKVNLNKQEQKLEFTVH